MFEKRKKKNFFKEKQYSTVSMEMCYFQFKFNLFTDIEYNSLHFFASSSNFSHLSYFQFQHWIWYVDGIIVFVFHLNSRNWETNQMRDGKKIRLYLWCQHCICVWCVFTVVAIFCIHVDATTVATVIIIIVVFHSHMSKYYIINGKIKLWKLSMWHIMILSISIMYECVSVYICL